MSKLSIYNNVVLLLVSLSLMISETPAFSVGISTSTGTTCGSFASSSNRIVPNQFRFHHSIYKQKNKHWSSFICQNQLKTRRCQRHSSILFYKDTTNDSTNEVEEHDIPISEFTTPPIPFTFYYIFKGICSNDTSNAPLIIIYLLIMGMSFWYFLEKEISDQNLTDSFDNPSLLYLFFTLLMGMYFLLLFEMEAINYTWIYVLAVLSATTNKNKFQLVSKMNEEKEKEWIIIMRGVLSAFVKPNSTFIVFVLLYRMWVLYIVNFFHEGALIPEIASIEVLIASLIFSLGSDAPTQLLTYVFNMIKLILSSPEKLNDEEISNNFITLNEEDKRVKNMTKLLTAVIGMFFIIPLYYLLEHVHWINLFEIIDKTIHAVLKCSPNSICAPNTHIFYFLRDL